MLAIIDLEVSNVGSLTRGFERLEAEFLVTRSPAALEAADGIVLPGVGAFGDAMASLHDAKLVELLRRLGRESKPILGVCLGMQLLAERSEEFGQHEGLGLVPGRVVRLVPGRGGRVPNIGWCDVYPRPGARLFGDVSEKESFYFVHSYHLVTDRPEIVAATMPFADGAVVVAVEHENLFGVQFHPEKSQDPGLSVLDAFVRLTGSERSCASTSESRA